MHFHPEWAGAMRHGKSSESRPAVTGDACADRAAGLGATRVAWFRERVRSGYYGSPAAVDALAARLLASGDI
jgi:phage tail tape-measure protein